MRYLNRLSARFCAEHLRGRKTAVENHHSAEHNIVGILRTLRLRSTLIPGDSSLRIIIETLAMEWDSSSAYTNRTPPESSADGPARKLRRLRLTLSPLFFIGSNVLKLISPDCKDHCREVCVRGTEWKTLLRRRPRGSSVSSAHENIGLASRRRSQSIVNQEIDPTSVLCGSRDEIIDLWADPLVRQTLERHKVYLEQMPGL